MRFPNYIRPKNFDMNNKIYIKAFNEIKKGSIYFYKKNIYNFNNLL